MAIEEEVKYNIQTLNRILHPKWAEYLSSLVEDWIELRAHNKYQADEIQSIKKRLSENDSNSEFLKFIQQMQEQHLKDMESLRSRWRI